MANLVASDIQVGDVLPELEKKLRTQHIISAAAASRDWQPIHHDHYIATEKSGLRGIILNAPSQTGWISRFITDWTGPEGRIKSLGFKMRDSICPNDQLKVKGEVTAIEDAGEAGTFLIVNVNLMVEDQLKTEAEVKVAVPTSKDGPRPWNCCSDIW